MTSNNTYTSSKPMPYVYIVTNKETGEFYIGYRSNNSLPSNEDLPKYKTSSKYVKPIFYKFEYTIIAEFLDGDSAYDYEQFLIYENWLNPLLLNKSCHYGKSRFRLNIHSTITKNKLSKASREYFSNPNNKEKISECRKGRTPWNKDKLMSNEFKSICSERNKGKKLSNQHKESIRNSLIGKKRHKNICNNISKSKIDKNNKRRIDGIPLPNTKKISVDKLIFNSIGEAATFFGRTPSTLTYWIKTGKAKLI